MIVGVPKEIKAQENRVGLVPGSVRELIQAGAKVLVEKGAGAGIGIGDEAYLAAGAKLVKVDEIFSQADLIIKVKEPQPIECRRLSRGQTLFTYLHLASDPEQTRLLKESGVTAIGYETVTQEGGGLPLLMPMSQVAGRMSIQAGAHCLEMAQGGSGVLLGGVPGVAAASVVVLGGGVVGSNAIAVAMGMGAHVSVLDSSLTRLRELDNQFSGRLNTIYASMEAVEYYSSRADLIIGAVLIHGAAAPKLLTRPMLRSMRPGSVLVDVSIDQGGCFATSKPTTHHEPTYVIDGVIHYCVANMPAAVPRTSTFALNNATLPYVLRLVKDGVNKALLDDKHFLNGLNIHQGNITFAAVATNLGYHYVSAREALVGA